jgi:hypothetical protein
MLAIDGNSEDDRQTEDKVQRERDRELSDLTRKSRQLLDREKLHRD